jgi:hypothetical protein
LQITKKEINNFPKLDIIKKRSEFQNAFFMFSIFLFQILFKINIK